METGISWKWKCLTWLCCHPPSLRHCCWFWSWPRLKHNTVKTNQHRKGTEIPALELTQLSDDHQSIIIFSSTILPSNLLLCLQDDRPAWQESLRRRRACCCWWTRPRWWAGAWRQDCTPPDWIWTWIWTWDWTIRQTCCTGNRRQTWRSQALT